MNEYNVFRKRDQIFKIILQEFVQSHRKADKRILPTGPDVPIKSFFFPAVAREKSITMPKLKRDDIDRRAYECERVFVDFTLWIQRVKIETTMASKENVTHSYKKLNYSP